MHERNRLTYVVAMMCFVVMTLGGSALGVLGWSLITSASGPGSDMASWAQMPGEKFSTLQVRCQSPWRTDSLRGTRTCERLMTPPSIASGQPTRVVVTMDPVTDRIGSIQFTVEPYSPRLQRDRFGEYGMRTWTETVADDALTADCRPHYAPYLDAQVWQCHGHAFGHTGVVRDGNLDARAHFWIGATPDDFAASFHKEGRAELRQRASQHLRVANDHFHAGQFAAADRRYLNAYLALTLLPSTHQSGVDRKTRSELAQARLRLRHRAQAQRQAYDSAPPLASHRGVLHLRALMERSPAEMEVLLGPPRDCTKMKTKEFCVYGGETWTVKVAFNFGSSFLVSASFPQGKIPFAEEGLANLDLPRAAPTHRSLHNLRWDNFAGFDRVEFFRNSRGNFYKIEAQLNR